MSAIRDWFFGLPGRRLVWGTLVVGGLVVLAKFLAALREMVAAACYGTGDVMDAFVLAMTLATFPVSMLAGAVQLSLVPVIVAASERRGPEAGAQVASAVLAMFAALLMIVMILAGLAGPLLLGWIGGAFDPSKQAVALGFLVCLLPMLLCGGLSPVATVVLNARRVLAWPGVAGILGALGSLGALAAFGAGGRGSVLVAAFLLGAILECGLLVVGLARHQWLSRFTWAEVRDDVRAVFRESLPAAAAQAIMMNAPLINQAFAVSLGSGTLAAMYYGIKLPAFLVSVGAVALSGVLLPHYSRLVVTEPPARVMQNFRHVVQRVIGVSALFVLLLMLFSEPINRFLFQRGAFDASRMPEVASVTAALALQIPFYLVGIIGARLLSAWGLNRWLWRAAVANLAVNGLSCALLCPWLGVSGIALAVSLGYAASCGLIFRVLTAHSGGKVGDRGIPNEGLRGDLLSRRVLLIASRLGCGGTEKQIALLAGGLSANGWEVGVAACDERQDPFFSLPVKVRRFEADSSNAARPGRLASNWRRLAWLKRILAEWRPTVCVSFLNRNNILALLAAHGTGIPVVISERAPEGWSETRIWRTLRRLTYPWAAFLVVQTGAMRQLMQDKGCPRISVIPNLIEWPVASARPGADAPRLRRPALVSAGRLVPQKNFGLLLDAFARCEHRREWFLYIFGDGVEKQALEQRRRSLPDGERMVFAGTVRDMATIYPQADLFALTSRYEGFPNVVAEAMAFGVAVVASRSGTGASGIIRDGVDGVLATSDDSLALAKTLDRLMGDAAERKRLGEAARESVARFGAGRGISEWKALLTDCIQRS